MLSSKPGPRIPFNDTVTLMRGLEPTSDLRVPRRRSVKRLLRVRVSLYDIELGLGVVLTRLVDLVGDLVH